MNSTIIKEALSYVLAKDLHNLWREKRKLTEGGYQPKIKKSLDDIWNLEHKKDVVDIANCSYEELPSNWKMEYIEAARVVIEQVYDKTVAGDSFSDEEIEKIASIIHDEWLKRNVWVYDSKDGNPELTVSYEKLSSFEKEKDREQIFPAISIVKSYVNGLIDIDSIYSDYNN